MSTCTCEDKVEQDLHIHDSKNNESQCRCDCCLEKLSKKHGWADSPFKNTPENRKKVEDYLKSEVMK